MHSDRARSRATAELNIGDRVTAVGYPEDRNGIVTVEGTVLGLYEFDGGRVIRTDAPFEFGASGGGLFDQEGNFVAVLAFKARTAPLARFALPSEWIGEDGGLSAQLCGPEQAYNALAFWERPRDARPEFLGLALRESRSAKH